MFQGIMWIPVFAMFVHLGCSVGVPGSELYFLGGSYVLELDKGWNRSRIVFFARSNPVSYTHLTLPTSG